MDKLKDFICHEAATIQKAMTQQALRVRVNIWTIKLNFEYDLPRSCHGVMAKELDEQKLASSDSNRTITFPFQTYTRGKI